MTARALADQWGRHVETAITTQEDPAMSDMLDLIARAEALHASYAAAGAAGSEGAATLSDILCTLRAMQPATPPETEAEARARVASGVADLLDPATVIEQLGGGNG